MEPPKKKIQWTYYRSCHQPHDKSFVSYPLISKVSVQKFWNFGEIVSSVMLKILRTIFNKKYIPYELNQNSCITREI